MSEEENERDFIKTCFNIVAGLEVKNESQAIAKEAILDEVEYLTKENKQLKEVIEEVREVINEMVHTGYILKKDNSATQFMATSEKSEFGVRAEVLLQILDKGENNE